MTTVRYRRFNPFDLDTQAGMVRMCGLAAAVEDLLLQLDAPGAYDIEWCPPPKDADETGFEGPYLLLARSDRPTKFVKLSAPSLREMEPVARVFDIRPQLRLSFEYAVYDQRASLRKLGRCFLARLLGPVSWVVAEDDADLKWAGAEGEPAASQ